MECKRTFLRNLDKTIRGTQASSQENYRHFYQPATRINSGTFQMKVSTIRRKSNNKLSVKFSAKENQKSMQTV